MSVFDESSAARRPPNLRSPLAVLQTVVSKRALTEHGLEQGRACAGPATVRVRRAGCAN
jgi:hypothetical protein